MLGVVHGVVAGVSFGMMPMMHPRMGPGKDLGTMVPAGVIMLHGIFGIVVGILY